MTLFAEDGCGRQHHGDAARGTHALEGVGDHEFHGGLADQAGCQAAVAVAEDRLAELVEARGLRDLVERCVADDEPGYGIASIPVVNGPMSTGMGVAGWISAAAGRRNVTGGTRGIERAIVEALVDEGAAVAFCARTSADVELTVNQFTTLGAQVVGHMLDVSDGDGLASWVDDAAAQLGGLDIAVANVSAMAVPDEGEESWQRRFTLDMMSTVACSGPPYLTSSAARRRRS